MGVINSFLTQVKNGIFKPTQTGGIRKISKVK